MPNTHNPTNDQSDVGTTTILSGDIFMSSWSNEKGMDDLAPPVSSDRLDCRGPTINLGRKFSFSSAEVLDEAEEARSSILTSNRLDDIIQCARPGENAKKKTPPR